MHKKLKQIKNIKIFIQFLSLKFRKDFFYIFKFKLHFSFYEKYIFKTYAKEFLLWSCGMYFVLMSLTFVDLIGTNLPFFRKASFIFATTMTTFFDMFEIVVLCACVSFFIRSRNFFNFTILNSFGIKSGTIIQMMIYFLLLIEIIKFFLIQPAIIWIYNDNVKYQKVHSKLLIKSGTKIETIDSSGDEMIFVKSIYKNNTKEQVNMENAVIIQYLGNEPHKIYVANNLILHDNEWQLKNVNIVSQKDQNKQTKAIVSIPTNLKVSKFVSNLQGEIKFSYGNTFKLDIYDNLIAFFFAKNQTEKSEFSNNARANLTLCILEMLNCIVCCLLTFFFCVSASRNISIIKVFLQSFLSFFIVMRFSHIIFPSMVGYSFMSIIAICIELVFIEIGSLLVYEKDWNGKISKFFKLEKIKLSYQ